MKLHSEVNEWAEIAVLNTVEGLNRGQNRVSGFVVCGKRKREIA